MKVQYGEASMVIGRSHSIKDYPGQLTGLMMVSALIGAVTALFTTPRTGYEARTRLKERGRRMKGRWQEYMREDDNDAPDTGDIVQAARQTKETAKTVTTRNRGGNNKSKEGEP